MAIALLTAMQVSAQGLPPSAIVSSDRTGAASGVGAIRGSVKDETGACIAGAEVLLCGLAEGGVTVRADEAGQFTFEGVPAAGYRLRVSAAGFRSFETPTLVVNGSETEVVDTVLSVGMGGEIVVVGNSRAFCHVWKFNPDAIDVESQHVLPGPALLTAIDRGEKRLREALDAGASPNELFAFGRTPLMHAADNEDLVRLLLERGADPTLRDEAGATALHYAALADDGATVFALCRAGCDPNVADFEGITPLIVAALDGNEDAVSALVAAGANVHARDVGGRSALDYAREEEREEVIEILEVAGAK